MEASRRNRIKAESRTGMSTDIPGAVTLSQYRYYDELRAAVVLGKENGIG